MKSRITLIIVAVILALLATLGSTIYLQNLKAQIVRGNEMVKVFVAKTATSPGSTVEDLLNQDKIGTTSIPRRYLVTGAITNAQGLTKKVLLVPLTKGEQLTDSKLGDSGGSGLSVRIPNEMVAIALPVDDVAGVGGQISAGDTVSLIATFTPGPNGVDTSRMFLSGISVMATTASSSTTSSDQKTSVGQSGATLFKKTITVAVTPQDAERLVFAAETGHVWVALQPAEEKAPSQTSGQTVETILP